MDEAELYELCYEEEDYSYIFDCCEESITHSKSILIISPLMQLATSQSTVAPRATTSQPTDTDNYNNSFGCTAWSAVVCDRDNIFD